MCMMIFKNPDPDDFLFSSRVSTSFCSKPNEQLSLGAYNSTKFTCKC